LAWLIVFGLVIHVVVIIGLLLVMYQYHFTKRLVSGSRVVMWPLCRRSQNVALATKHG
jgi:hypothetical protein